MEMNHTFALHRTSMSVKFGIVDWIINCKKRTPESLESATMDLLAMDSAARLIEL